MNQHAQITYEDGGTVAVSLFHSAEAVSPYAVAGGMAKRQAFDFAEALEADGWTVASPQEADERAAEKAEDWPLDENYEYEVQPFANGGMVGLTLGELVDLAEAHGVGRQTVISLSDPEGDYRNVSHVGVPVASDPEQTWCSLTLTRGDYFDSRFVP